MPYNPAQEFEEKLFALDMRQFYTHQFMRGNLHHYTNELGISEGIIYAANDFSIPLLKRLTKASDVKLRLYGDTFFYNEDTREISYEDPQWLNIDKLILSNTSYHDDYFEGANDDLDCLNMFLNSATHFLILPTRKPKQARSYEPCNLC